MARPGRTGDGARTRAFALATVVAAAGLAAPAAAAEGGRSGMPQLDPAFFTPQIIWLVIIFVLLYLLLWRVALPRVAEVLEERKTRISDNLDKATTQKAEAEEVLAEYEKTTAEGRAEAQSMLRQTAAEMAAESARRQAALAEKLSTDIQAAEVRIGAARKSAAANVRTLAADVAQAATARLIGVEVDQASAGAAVGDAMKKGE